MSEKAEVQVHNSAKFTLILTFVCLFFLGFATHLARNIVEMNNNGLKAVGIVTGHKTRIRSGQQHNTYSLIVEFVDQGGRKNEFTDRISNYPASHNVGDEVQVLYLAGDPDRSMVDLGAMNWIFSFVFLGLGGLGGVYCVRQYMKLRRKIV